MKRWKECLLALSAMGPTLLGVSCSADMRDAALGGALDFVSGTITDGLTALVPLAEWMEGFWGA